MDNQLKTAKPYKCSECDHRSYKLKSSLLHHIKRTHLQLRPHKCKFCEKSFFSRWEVKNHQLVHTTANKKTLPCPHCDKSYKNYPTLIEHITVVHIQVTKFQCTFCNKLFCHNSKLEDHMLTHTTEKTFKCQICNRLFARKRQLILHSLLHTGQKPFKCYFCYKGFTQKVNLRNHLLIHLGEKVFYKCNFCSRKISDKFGFQRHMLVHLGEAQYKCLMCPHDQFFYSNPDLKTHMKVYHPSKPRELLKCNFCIKSFLNPPGLQTHLKIVHGVGLDNKRFKCDLCPKSFILSRQLFYHKRSHSQPFHCPKCETRMTTKRDLALHVMRRHTEEKPLECYFCEYACVDGKSLRFHLSTHTTEKPFECHGCNKGFACRGRLERHSRFHCLPCKIKRKLNS